MKKEKDNKNIQKIDKESGVFKLYRIINKIVSNPGNIYSGIKYRNRYRFLDGFLGKKYCYISSNRYMNSKEWNDYFNNKDSYEKLLNGLDPDSVLFVERYNKIVKTIIDNYDLCVPREMLLFSNNVDSHMIKGNINEYSKEFLGLGGKKLPEVFFYKHGIYTIPGILDYTKGKDIIDCGSYIGDSALMLSKELAVKNIFCCEPDKNNYETLCNVIKLNKKTDTLIPLEIGVGSKECIVSFDGGEGGGSRTNKTGNCEVKINTIDNITNENNINPGLIKRDIEGLEYDSILGAKETIKKYKPILIISIYHTPKDFFEIKPLLDSWNLGYKFKIVHCHEGLSPAEIMLLCWI